MHGGEGVPKCVIFDVRSILEVQFLSENVSLYMVIVGLRNFSRYNVRAWKSYDQPSLNLNNSTIWRDTLTIFSEFLHRNTIYEKLAWNLQHDALFPGKVPVNTPHSERSHNAWKNLLSACMFEWRFLKSLWTDFREIFRVCRHGYPLPKCGYL